VLRTYNIFECIKSLGLEPRSSVYIHYPLAHDTVTHIDLRRDTIFLDSPCLAGDFDVVTHFLGNSFEEIRSLAISWNFCRNPEVYLKLRKLRHL